MNAPCSPSSSSSSSVEVRSICSGRSVLLLLQKCQRRDWMGAENNKWEAWRASKWMLKASGVSAGHINARRSFFCGELKLGVWNSLFIISSSFSCVPSFQFRTIGKRRNKRNKTVPTLVPCHLLYCNTERKDKGLNMTQWGRATYRFRHAMNIVQLHKEISPCLASDNENSIWILRGSEGPMLSSSRTKFTLY